MTLDTENFDVYFSSDNSEKNTKLSEDELSRLRVMASDYRESEKEFWTILENDNSR